MTATEKLVRLAWHTGCPSDQLENFLAAGYVPQPKQLEFHAAARQCDEPDGPDEVGFGGARGPGKSHAAFAQLALDDCQRVAGLKGLYLRKTGKNAREQFEDLRRSVLRFMPHKYNRNEGVVTFDNDSRVFIGHFQNEKDIDNYLGIEYDVIAIEETTTLTLVKYRTLRDSNRTSKPGWRPRIYNTTNPGNIGHTWYKQKFILPARRNEEEYTRFIFATVDDNKMIDVDYTRKLEENTGWRLRAYRFGDWDIAAGQFFSTWDHDAHVCPAFMPEHYWKFWAALDYGFQHPTACYLLSQDQDGIIYVVDEYRQSGALVPQQAEAIKAMLGRYNLEPQMLRKFVAGHDIFAKRGGDSWKSMTIADQFKAEGIKLTHADIDRINGAGEFLKRLGNPREGIPPTLQIMERCNYLIECIPAMIHDPNRPEDVLKVDVDEDGNGGDDPYDAARYGLMDAKQKRVGRAR